MYVLTLHPRVYKQLEKLPVDIKERVTARIRKLSLDPFSINNLDIKKMAGVEDSYRLRVGNIRVIYEIFKKSKTIYVEEIDWRGNIY